MIVYVSLALVSMSESSLQANSSTVVLQHIAKQSYSSLYSQFTTGTTFEANNLLEQISFIITKKYTDFFAVDFTVSVTFCLYFLWSILFSMLFKNKKEIEVFFFVRD